MISGTIDANLEARVKLQVIGSRQTKEVEFLIDTGFNGFLSVPNQLVHELDLPLGAVQSGVTADGRLDFFDTVAVEILWNEVSTSIRAQILNEPLIGTRLLRGHSLTAEWVPGGVFRIDRLNDDSAKPA